MFRINKIQLTQFKNYENASFDLHERVVGICGLNGQGKTNLLDAVYYCCFTKSYFSATDTAAILFNKDGFRLQAEFTRTGQQANIICIHRLGGKKELSLNDVPYEKFSQHLGKFPVVMIAPDDIELITGASEVRRKYLDMVLSQMDNEYLTALIRYNKILQQRNSLLKRFAEQGSTDWPLLEVLDEQLVIPGNYIYQCRKSFCIELIPLVKQFYHQIANNEEQINVQYDSRLHDQSFEGLLHVMREKDFILQRTNGGIHKDDISIQLNEQPFKTTASQGQRKSLLFALKLAEFELLKSNKGFAPLLLLDDVFEKLDDQRMHQLLQWVCTENKGQVLITDTHRGRLENAFEALPIPFQIIELK